MNNGARNCIYGAQYGSEGKGCVAEYLIKTLQLGKSQGLVVLGENAPNSGHTDAAGHKTRSLPVTAYLADIVILGPDSAIDPVMLNTEIQHIRVNNPRLIVFVHRHAALVTADEIEQEKGVGLEQRISSTVTGGGAARCNKALLRKHRYIIGNTADGGFDFLVVNNDEYFDLLHQYRSADWVLECSQGLWLDLNLGIYPYVTSRSTNPRTVIERNGWGPSSEWHLTGVHRTYPIRTGGPSGPTPGEELTWEELGVKPEITSVTKRVRRVFAPSYKDFQREMEMVQPDLLAFTHLDYLKGVGVDGAHGNFLSWVNNIYGDTGLIPVIGSDKPGNFYSLGVQHV